MDFLTLQTQYKPQIIELAERYGLFNIRVFGSVAEGRENESSDIDILVSARPGTSLLMLAGFQNRLEDMLRCHVDVVTDGKKFSDSSIEAIKNKAKPL